ncbi:MAG: TonB-dependent receptor plug domain-containing protein [Methylomonas sp.]|nr:TonB-dependent receptor plug domain-containing protein [Methylomonas sp.]
MKRLSATRHFSIMLAAACGTPSYAADTALPSIEVVGDAEDKETREDLKPESIKNRYRVPLSNRAGVETFTVKEIEALKPKDVFDLLDKATGMTVTYQGRRNPFFVKERGGGSFTYIINGAILPTVTQRILQKIPLKAIEELQVVRDATALTLGPLVNIGASGSGDGLNTGFIIIRTRQPKKDEFSLTGAVEQADGQPVANKESLLLGKRLSYQGVEGYVGGLGSRLDKPSEPEWFDGQNADAGMVSSGLEYGILKLDFMAYADTGRFEMQRAAAGLATAATNQMKWYYDPIDTAVFSLDGALNWDENHSSLFSLFQTSFNQTENSTNFPPYSNAIKAADNFSYYWEKTQGWSFRHHMKYDGTILQLGAQQTRSMAQGSSGSNANTKWDTEVLGFGATLEQRLFDERLSLDAGIRRDSKHATTSTAALNNANSNVDMPAATALSFGGRWQVTPTYALNARYFNGDQGTQGDLNIQSKTGTLHPEKQQRMEFGIEAKFMPQFIPSLTWFDVKIDNQKSQTSTTYSLYGNTYYYYTESNNRREGLELMIRGSFGEHSRYKVGWTHMTSNISSNASVANTNANDLINFSVEQDWGPYILNASMKHVGAYDGGGPGAGGPGGSFAADQQWHTIGNYTRVDANVSREFILGPSDLGGLQIGQTTLKATLYAQNLGNVHYMTIYPWQDRGRILGAEISINY